MKSQRKLIKGVPRKTGQATTDLVRKAIRDGMDMEEIRGTEDIIRGIECTVWIDK